MSPARQYALLSCVSGALWGGVVGLITLGALSRAIWGGVLASPLIGLLVGLATKRMNNLPVELRVLVALLSLYVAAALFGLAMGVYDWLVIDSPNRVPLGVVLQNVLAILWGLTLTGYLFLFWPLAYLNHALLARLRPPPWPHDARP